MGIYRPANLPGMTQREYKAPGGVIVGWQVFVCWTVQDVDGGMLCQIGVVSD